MAFLLPPEQYDAIRYAIDPMLDDQGIPNELIESVGYLPAAERWAKARDPLFITRSGEELELLHRGIIMKAASLISMAIPQVRQTNMAGHTATFNYAETAKERSARLAALAEMALDEYLVVSVSDLAADAPIFVTTVSGRRG